MKKYKDALIESVVTPSVDNAELYQDETKPKRYQTPQDDIIKTKSVEAEKYQDSKEDVFKTHTTQDRIADLLKEQYNEDDEEIITTLDDIEKKMIEDGKISEEEEEVIQEPEEPKDENKGKAKDEPEEAIEKSDKDKNELKEVTVEEQEDPEQKEEKEEEETDKEQEEENDEEDALNEELEQLLSLYEEELKIDPDQEHLTDIPESDDGEDLEDILGDEGDYIADTMPKKEKVKIPNADSDNPTSSETTGYSDISESDINYIVDTLFNESYKVKFKKNMKNESSIFDENISLFQDSEDIEEADIVTESSNVDQDEMDTITETFSDIEKNMLLDALNEDRDIEDLLDEILNEK